MPPSQTNLRPLDSSTKNASSRAKISIFSLPPELRHKIYRCALVSPESQMMIGIHDGSSPLCVVILRTCRAIHREAIPILYGANTIQFSYSSTAFKWLNTIGKTNIGYIRTLRMFIEACVEQSFLGMPLAPSVRWSSKDGWVKVLQKLGVEAKGIRRLHVYCDRMGMHRGLGSEEAFLGALGGLRPSETMEIGGIYDRHWPGHLERSMGVRVLDSPT